MAENLPTPAKAATPLRRYGEALNGSPSDEAVLALFEVDGAPLDLTPEMALARTVLYAYVKEHGLTKHFGIMRLIETIQHVAESQAKIDSSTSLTLPQVMKLMHEMGMALERIAKIAVTKPEERMKLLHEVRDAWLAIRV